MTSTQPEGLGDGRSLPRGFSLKKVALTAAAALVSINVWTGAPLLAIWIGSRVFTSMALSLNAVSFVVALIAVFEYLLLVTLARLNSAYDELTGRPTEVRHWSPWLRDTRGERLAAHRFDRRVSSSPIELVVMASVVLAALVFEVYFFFFAHPALPRITANGM